MKQCYECGITLTDKNKGRWSPHWCDTCDEKRVKHIDQNVEDMLKELNWEVS